jgi:hypothetical protein
MISGLWGLVPEGIDGSDGSLRQLRPFSRRSDLPSGRFGYLDYRAPSERLKVGSVIKLDN